MSTASIAIQTTFGMVTAYPDDAPEETIIHSLDPHKTRVRQPGLDVPLATLITCYKQKLSQVRRKDRATQTR